MPEISSLPQQLENTDQTYSELATINRRLNLLENRINNIGDQVNLIENSLNEKHKSANSGISDLDGQLKIYKDKILELESEMRRLISVVGNFATKQGTFVSLYKESNGNVQFQMNAHTNNNGIADFEMEDLDDEIFQRINS